MSTKIRALEQSCAAALRSALTARNKLSAAREAEDEVDVRAFLTLDEHRAIVRAQRRDHQAALAERDRQMLVMLAIATGATSHPDFPEVAKYAEIGARMGPLLRAMKDKVVDIKEARTRRAKED